MQWLLFNLLGSVVSAGNNVLDKKLMGMRELNPLACTLSFGIVGLPLALIAVLFMPAVHWQVMAWALSTGGLFTIAAWLYYDTVARFDISLLAPLLRLSTFQTVVGSALILRQVLTPRHYLALSILFCSSIVLSFSKGMNARMQFSGKLWRILPVTSLLALNNLMLVPLYRGTFLLQGLCWENAGMVLGLVVISPIILLRRGHVPLRTVDRRTWLVLIGEQTTRLLIGLGPDYAIAQGVPIALISTINSFGPLWVWLLAIFVLKERTGGEEIPIKIAGICGTILAVVLLI